MPYIAHVTYDAQREAWRAPHDLAEHLRETGKLAVQFAERYGAGWARLSGQWHDLGKYRPRFQRYIRHKSGYEPDASIQGELGRAPHSTAGALLACDRFGLPGRALAYLIAGHHAGLDDWYGGLRERLADPASRAELDETLAESIPPDLLDTSGFTPDLRAVPGKIEGFALWVRMLFSAMVDADFLDTERYMSPGKFEARNCWPSLFELAPRFDAFMTRKSREALPTPVNAVRAEVLRQCREAASQPPGIFSLTVPTGGGKTLSSMAFALGHALCHGKRRIVYAIPYTSIIEQTAKVYREVFGEDAIVEHHSNVEASSPEHETSASRLASENWDAPIIVTTNVQLFESLFANRPSRCRKLHNLVDSVIVLDEAHLLPPQFLQPILDVMRLLVEHYGVTFVLSTATQPVLASRQAFDPRRNVRGLDNVREIISNPDDLYERLDRVQVRLPADWRVRQDWPDLAQEIVRHPSVLAIVNTRAHARALWQEMPEGTLHLSALMCPAHRSAVIGHIKERLNSGIPTRVVSTQLVEAGVDLDFPVVYRALAGLDSIAQAAGRCNREGKLSGKGEVVVFIPPQSAPPGLLRKGEDACRKVLYGIDGNPLERSLFAAYFTQFYHACDLDEKGIGRMLAAGRELDVRFRAAAEAFCLIDDEDTSPVVVRYHAEGGNDVRVDELLAILERDGPQRWLLRLLQPYMVTLYRRDVARLLSQGGINEMAPGLFVQTSDGLYHPMLGFDPQDGMGTDPAITIV